MDVILFPPNRKWGASTPGSVQFADKSVFQSTTSTAFADVTGLSAQLECVGKPVQILLTANPSNVCYIFADSADAGANGEIAILRGSTVIASWRFGSQHNGSTTTNAQHPLCLQTIDNPGPGTFTYKVQFRSLVTGETVTLQYNRLIVWEMT